MAQYFEKCIFLNMTQKELLIRGKTDKSGYINFKIHSLKDTVK